MWVHFERQEAERKAWQLTAADFPEMQSKHRREIVSRLALQMRTGTGTKSTFDLTEEHGHDAMLRTIGSGLLVNANWLMIKPEQAEWLKKHGYTEEQARKAWADWSEGIDREAENAEENHRQLLRRHRDNHNQRPVGTDGTGANQQVHDQHVGEPRTEDVQAHQYVSVDLAAELPAPDFTDED